MARPFTIIELSREAGLRLLAEHHLGRIAFAVRDRVDVEPISYVYGDGWIWARTSPGTKLTMVTHHPYVAFEVDEVKSPSDWRSVVVHGTVYVLQEGGGEIARETYRVALGRIRELVPMALTPRDPTPTRQVILKLHPSDLRGRSASSRDSG